ncbi:uncharacterized protein BYT42DRAFT_73738 [Radiomyces spectabilis]|uniref:uncharacterized protein n=1 Tax=Radiomyces spectabilis TaxID=64574 RepID=UPI00221F99C4|nr:uncharacterized protein BYT42DRAFT_73738 [Radiomyces spectabilis]KAI8371573.1 hypothetical protein BYT42DRAFT_73738 [Radiomyces spectabilis]
MDYGHYALALQAMYVLPPAIWDTNCFRLAITLHLMQEPRQIAEVERLLSDYGKTHITLANPLAPFDLPPIRIDMPNMKNVADSDKYALWMYYQAACSETEWGKEKENYEAKSYEHAQQLKQQRHGRETLKDWAMRRFKVETEQDRLQRDKIEADNTMIYISTQNHQFEYAWHVYERMGKEVDAFTPRVVMHLSWQAYKHTPIAHVSLRTHWEDRAWELYSRFMDSEYLYPNQTETPGFLGDLLSIASTTIGVHDGAQFDKVMELYQLFQDRGYERLLSNEQVITPLLCTLIYQCRRSPQSMDSMRRKAFQIWRTKHAIDQKTEGKHPSTAYSILWILLVFCVHSGDKTDFAELLVTLSSHYVDNLPPTSLLAPIQRFHDRYLSCSHGSTPCHFHHYLFRPVDSPDKDPSGYMDDLGFVRGDSRRASSASSIDVTSLPEPIAHMYETLHRRTNIHDMGAASMDAAVSFSLTNHGQWVTKPFYCPLNKAQALIRHCLGRKEIHDRVKSTVA